MKKSKLFNNGVDVSKLRLKRGETKIFKLLKVKKDKTSPTGFYIPSAANVPNRDVIEIKGEIYDIAAIKSIGLKGNEVFHRLWFTKEAGGQIVVHGGRIADQEIYEYLMLSNYRSNNPNRDPSRKQIYKLVDVSAEVKVQRASRSQRLKAELYASEMTDAEVMTFAAASGWSDKSFAIVRNRIEVMAEENPINFLKIASNRHNSMKADVKNALDKKIISFDKGSHEYAWATNNELIVVVPRSTKGTHLDGMLNFLINTEHGESVYQEIKSLLNPDKTTETPVPEKEVIAEVKKEPVRSNPKPIAKKPTTRKK